MVYGFRDRGLARLAHRARIASKPPFHEKREKMALNPKEASRGQLIEAFTKMGAGIKRKKEKYQKKIDAGMSVAVSAAGAGGAGWVMGGRQAAIEKDTSLVTPEQKEEAMKLMGYVDPDLAAGIVFSLGGLAMKGKYSQSVTDFGSGILSYYVGSKAFDAARERAMKA